MYVATALFSLRTTLRVDEKYAPDTTPATYQTVSPTRAGDSKLHFGYEKPFCVACV
jgi:hypothetical protein